MLRRCRNWDYRERRIYMVTFCTDGRKPVLGRLAGTEKDARIELSGTGRILEGCWKELPERYPQVSLLEWQVMPDHFHGIVFVRERLPKPLGALIGTVKAHSSSLWRSVVCAGACAEDLWSPGYQDNILFHDGQLAKMRAYILDNPRRLAVKRAHPELFRIVRNLRLCDMVFSAIGNHFLLDRPERLQIQCSRSITPEALAKEQERILFLGRHGAVAVSPCVSPGEKQIARAVMEAGLPLIVLLENGFAPMYKPPGKYFEACSEGRLLMLAPWQHHTERRTITREQCLQLNEHARRICR